MEKINLVEILKHCKRGTNLYSSTFGELVFVKIIDDVCSPIVCCKKDSKGREIPIKYFFMEDGKYTFDGECVLFPSKEQRNWTKFKVNKPKFNPNTLQPFDKVLIKANALATWTANLFSCIDGKGIMCINGYFIEVIPYNEETKHLIGTRAELSEYYKWWED